jgi:hypothetical protein
MTTWLSRLASFTAGSSQAATMTGANVAPETFLNRTVMHAE